MKIKNLLSLLDGKLWRFLLVGVLNTLVGNGLSFVLLNLTDLGYWWSSAISYVLASIMSYFLNKYFTFRNTEKGWKPIFRFALNIAVCWVLAYGLAEPAVRWALSAAADKVQENVAMLVGMCLFTGFNYLGQRLFAFREKVPKDKGEND